ncbi:MFS transporter [Streptomyces sp. MS2A]|nr:MFS transporter [Streptomyces sp. MS2A]
MTVAELRTMRGGAVRPPLVLTALLVAVASFQMNATMLAPAVTSMTTELGTDAPTIGISASVFTFVAALAGLFWPPLSDGIGRRRALLVSLSVMSLGSLIAMLAVDVPMLMVGRALQGACGATFSLAFLLLREMLDARRFGRYLGIVTAVNAGVGGVDTLLGGVIADAIGFRGIFGLTLVLEILAVVLIAAWAPEVRPAGKTRMDWGGIGALTLALLGINFALSSAFSPGGWGAAATWAWFGVAAIALVAFRFIEDRVAQPLLPVRDFADRAVWGTLLTTFFTLASSFALLIFLVPTLSQDATAGFGLNGTVSALMFLVPYSLLGWATAPLVGTFAPRIGYRLLLRCGLGGSLLLATGMVLGHQNPWTLAILVFFMGATYSACAATTLNGLGIIYAPKAHPGILPGLTSTMFNFGASVGIGMLAATVAASPGPDGYRQAFVVAAVLAGLALLVSFALPAREREGERV